VIGRRPVSIRSEAGLAARVTPDRTGAPGRARQQAADRPATEWGRTGWRHRRPTDCPGGGRPGMERRPRSDREGRATRSPAVRRSSAADSAVRAHGCQPRGWRSIGAGVPATGRRRGGTHPLQTATHRPPRPESTTEHAASCKKYTPPGCFATTSDGASCRAPRIAVDAPRLARGRRRPSAGAPLTRPARPGHPGEGEAGHRARQRTRGVADWRRHRVRSLKEVVDGRARRPRVALAAVRRGWRRSASPPVRLRSST